MPPHKPYYGYVDLLRFVAAMMVMFYHLGWNSWQAGAGDDRIILAGLYRHPAPMPAFSFGWIGVQIFFVISGLVIANSATGVTAGTFLKHRIYRLYPTVWICASIGALIFLSLGLTDHLGSDYFRSIILWVHGPWLTGVYWTLAVEIMFYAIVFFWKLCLPTARIEHVAMALFTSAALYYICALLGSHTARLIAGAVPILSYATYFSVGIYIWLASQRKLRSIELLSALGAFVLCIGAILHNPYGGVVPAAFWTTAMIVLIATTQAPERFNTAKRRKFRIIRTIGLMTYPIYLFHHEVGTATMRLLMDNGANATIAILVGAIAVLALAFIVVEFLEPPLRRLLRSTVEFIETIPVRVRWRRV